MSDGIFKNGNKRKARLVIGKLIWGIAIMVLMQVQGYLPSLDFLSSNALKLISFVFAVLLSVSKGAEMFYDKTIQMLEHKEISFDTTTFTTSPPPTDPKL